MESVGFKEWALVCEALGHGVQTIILRKGGIAEGRAGFSFKHRDFFLFPTWFHEQPQKTRNAPIHVPIPGSSEITLRFLAKIDEAVRVTSWPIAEALEPLHVLQRQVVRERFEYDDTPGLYVAFVRTYQVTPPWTIPSEKKSGGCRSWVDLPTPPPNLTFQPVLNDMQHRNAKEQFQKTIGLT